MVFGKNGPQNYIKWEDTILSFYVTCHSASMAPISIKVREGSIQKFKPVAIIDYNKHKKGVE